MYRYKYSIRQLYFRTQHQYSLHCYCGDNGKYGLRTFLKTLVSKKMTIWQLKKSYNNNKLLEKITPPVITLNKKHSSKQVASVTYTLEKKCLQLLLLKVCESFRFGHIKKLEGYFGLYESSFTFIEKRRPHKCCLCKVNLISYTQVFSLMGQDMNQLDKQQFKMLVVFSRNFVGNTKIIFQYDFVAPLTVSLVFSVYKQTITPQ